MELLECLKQSALFDGLDDTAIRLVLDSAEVRDWPKASAVFREGDTGDEFYIIKSGSIAINKNVAGGMKRNLSNLGAGDVFGELALFDAQPRSADAEAMENTSLVVIHNARFHAILDDNPQFAVSVLRNIIRILCRRLRDTDEKLNEGVIWGFRVDY